MDSFREWFTTNKDKVGNIALAILVFFIPCNLFYKFFENTAYSRGLLIDYLIPKIYLSDLLVIIILSLWLIDFFVIRQKIKSINTKIKLIAVMVIIFFCRQFVAQYSLIALWSTSRIIVAGFFLVFLLNHQQNLNKNMNLFLAVVVTLLFQSILGITQFIKQSSVTNYYFFGETNLSNYAGIAKANFHGAEKILPYGATSHPNVLAGFLVIYLLLMFKLTSYQISNQKKILIGISTFLALITLYLTQSISAWISLVMAIGILAIHKLIQIKKLKEFFIPFLILIIMFFIPIGVEKLATYYPQNLSLTRRTSLNQSAVKMFKKHMLWGVGMNNFVPNLEIYSNSPEAVRFLQPVHHLGLLWLTETGIFGLCLGLILISSLKNKNRFYLLILILVAPITLDHYLLTNQVGILSLIMLIGILLNEEKQQVTE